MLAPPSTTRTAPVIKDESSLARKTQTPLIPRGSAILLRGTWDAKRPRIPFTSVLIPFANSETASSNMAVLVAPGQTTLHRIFEGPYPKAACWVRKMRPAFDVPYAGALGIQRRPPMEAIFMMDP